jgi:serine O-acetyltransferase
MSRPDLYTRLLYARQSRVLGKAAYYLLKLLGAEVPVQVRMGTGCLLVHGGYGVVIHPKTTLGDRVKIYPGVTLGRADIHRPAEESAFDGILVGDDVILSPGVKVLGKTGVLRIGRGAVIGANAVVLRDVPEDEIWAGIPAHRENIRKE